MKAPTLGHSVRHHKESNEIEFCIPNSRSPLIPTMGSTHVFKVDISFEPTSPVKKIFVQLKRLLPLL
jgi:hypothetical protein